MSLTNIFNDLSGKTKNRTTKNRTMELDSVQWWSKKKKMEIQSKHQQEDKDTGNILALLGIISSVFAAFKPLVGNAQQKIAEAVDSSTMSKYLSAIIDILATHHNLSTLETIKKYDRRLRTLSTAHFDITIGKEFYVHPTRREGQDYSSITDLLSKDAKRYFLESLIPHQWNKVRTKEKLLILIINLRIYIPLEEDDICYLFSNLNIK